MPCSQVTKLVQKVQQITEQVLDNFQIKNYFRSINVMYEVITMANWKLQTPRNFCGMNKLCTINTSLHVLQWLSCQDLAMILTSFPCIMICHDLDKDTMVNHYLGRFTMIMTRVPWLPTLGSSLPTVNIL